MNPDKNPLNTYGMVAGVVGQVGCLVVLVILGTMLLGLGFGRGIRDAPDIYLCIAAGERSP